MTSRFQELMNNLEQLRLTKMSAYLPEYLDQINGKQLSFTEAMLNLTKAELDWRQGEHATGSLNERVSRRLNCLRLLTLIFNQA